MAASSITNEKHTLNSSHKVIIEKVNIMPPLGSIEADHVISETVLSWGYLHHTYNIANYQFWSYDMAVLY